jgi:hypothetical protein
MVDMILDTGRFTSTIPAAYTDTPYPLQYYFSVFREDSAGLFPGLGAGLASQPYIVIRQG